MSFASASSPEGDNVFASFTPDFADLKLSKPLRHYLAKVYGTLAMTLACALGGFLLDLRFNLSGAISSIVFMCLSCYIFATRTTPESLTRRFYLVLLTGALAGLTSAPYIMSFTRHDPSLPLTALLVTFITYAAFTVAGFASTRPKYLYIGAFIGSALTYLCLFSTLNYFLGRALSLPPWTHTAVGLGITVAGVASNTSRIVYEFERTGAGDYVTGAAHLFIHFFSLFIRVLELLQRLSGENNKRRDRGRSSRTARA